jgi:hypothetical protein
MVVQDSPWITCTTPWRHGFADVPTVLRLPLDDLPRDRRGGRPGHQHLGEYVIRIYDQVRGRPQYVVDRTVNFSLPSQEDDTAGDAPYVELVKQAEQLLQEGAMAAERQAWRDRTANSETPVLCFPRSPAHG